MLSMIARGGSTGQTNRRELEVDKMPFNVIPGIKDCNVNEHIFHFVNWNVMLMKYPKGLSKKSIGGCYGVLRCERGLYVDHTLKLLGGLVVWVP